MSGEGEKTPLCSIKSTETTQTRANSFPPVAEGAVAGKTSMAGDCHPWRHRCRQNRVDRTQVLKDRMGTEKQVPGDGFESSLTASPCPLVICKQERGEEGTVAEASLPHARSSVGPQVGRTDHQ